MIETIPKTIEGHSYRLHQLGAKDGRHMLVRLTKVLGPALGRLADTDRANLSEALAQAIYELSVHLTEADLDWVCQTFGKRTELELEGGAIRVLDLELQELHFAGRYGAMVKWLGACLEVNFQDFFDTVASVGESAGLAPLGADPLSQKSPPGSNPG